MNLSLEDTVILATILAHRQRAPLKIPEDYQEAAKEIVSANGAFLGFGVEESRAAVEVSYEQDTLNTTTSSKGSLDMISTVHEQQNDTTAGTSFKEEILNAASKVRLVLCSVVSLNNEAECSLTHTFSFFTATSPYSFDHCHSSKRKTLTS